jgi:hypothetical protein
MSAYNDNYPFITPVMYTIGQGVLDPFLARQQTYVNASIAAHPNPNIPLWSRQLLPEDRNNPAMVRSALNRQTAGVLANTKYFQNPITSAQCNCRGGT